MDSLQPERRATFDDATDPNGSYPIRISSPSTALCQRCQGINVETLAATGGYTHSSLLAMSRNAATCKLCELILDTHRDRRRHWLFDRFQVVLYLRSLAPLHKEQLQDHPTQEGTQQEIRISHDHFKSSNFQTDQTPSGAQMWIQTLDDQPHLGDPARQGAVRHFGTPHPSRPSVNIVRERPLKCLTVQSDPAVDTGIHCLCETGSNTASETSFNVAKTWLRGCLTRQNLGPKYDILQSNILASSECPPVEIDHGWAAAQVDPSLHPEDLPSVTPARLIDVFPVTGGNDSARLIFVGSETLEYATLSYCWGQIEDDAWLTTKENLHMRLEGIQCSELPATIRDSLLIAKKLGIRYVWIDAICILQRDPEDWALEAAKMAGIYRGSVLTIAASASSSIDGGCFNTQSKSRIETSRNTIRIDSVLSNGRSSRLYLSISSFPNSYKEEVLNGPLSRRAWSYQEQVLSRRTLHYGASQIFWTCEHCILSEDNYTRSNEDWTYPIFAAQQPIKDKLLIDMWYLGAVTEFSRRDITYQSDKLIAISGLARVTYLNKHVDYIAGLWKDKMIEGLMWRRDGPGNKAKVYRCPSWSWASQDSAVDFGLATGRQPIDLLKSDAKASYADFFMPKVLDVSVELDSINSFGTVHGGCLTLDTIAATGLLLAQNSSEPESGVNSRISFPGYHRYWNLNVYLDDDEFESRSTHPVLCALIGYTWGHPVLLLLRSSNTDTIECTRIGIADFEGLQDGCNHGLESPKLVYDLIGSMKRQTIMIV